MEKRKVSVRLQGKDYTLLTEQPEERVQRIARYADRKMRELALASRSPDSTVAVLTCMTLAEELYGAQEENIQLRRKLAEMQSNNAAAGEQTEISES